MIFLGDSGLDQYIFTVGFWSVRLRHSIFTVGFWSSAVGAVTVRVASRSFAAPILRRETVSRRSAPGQIRMQLFGVNVNVSVVAVGKGRSNHPACCTRLS